MTNKTYLTILGVSCGVLVFGGVMFWAGTSYGKKITANTAQSRFQAFQQAGGMTGNGPAGVSGTAGRFGSGGYGRRRSAQQNVAPTATPMATGGSVPE